MTDLLPDVPEEFCDGCVSLGNFDGVHLGHQEMLGALRRLANALKRPAVAITFDPHPLQILRPTDSPPLITTLSQRRKLLMDAGADYVCCLPVTPTLLQMTAEEFFHVVLVRRFRVRGIVEGPNFMFGRDRGGNIETLKSLCDGADVACRIVELTQPDGRAVSSSAVRRLLAEGRLREAARLLGRHYQLTGIVAAGDGRGAGLGFPTANLTSIETLIPGDGVYAAITQVDAGAFATAVSIGPNPTFSSENRKVECHLIGFEGDLYGRTLDVVLLDRVRGLQRFQHADELKTQIARDVESVRSLAGEASVAARGDRRSK